MIQAASNAAKFRKLADGLQRQIDDKLRPMTQNPTPKRNREYSSRLIDGYHLQRAQRSLNAIADAIESGTLPPVLSGIKSKADVLSMVRTEIGSSGYYDVHDTGRYRDSSEAATALRQLAGIEKAPPVNNADQKKRAIALLEIEGFWPTPDDVCDQIVELAGIEPEHFVLEPSCGWGSIADAVVRNCGQPRRLDCYEIRQSLAEIAAENHAVAVVDFTETEPNVLFDRIVMNPPFERCQDIDHVRRAFDKFLKPGGRLVAILSRGVQFRSDRKTREFRDWVDDHCGEIEDLANDAFDRPGQLKRTGVAASVLVIEKAPEPAELVAATGGGDDFVLANDPPRHRRATFAGERYRQRMLIDGLDCLPGQGDLF